MIRIRGLTLSRGGRELLKNAQASLSPGERVALIGPNGSGKTSLLSALAGEGLIDAGEIEQPYSKVTRLAQSVPQSDLPAWEYLLEGDGELAAARRELAEAESALDSAAESSAQSAMVPEAVGLRLASAHQRWLDAGAAAAPARARALLAGLGFSDADAQAPVSNLSGGWRMRLNLARALFTPGELLLLDEPTNHLDLDAVIWLERWLARCECTMVIVSHDRDFLDRVVRACLHIEEGTLQRYAGGYSDFERARALREQEQQRAQQSAAARRTHLESFINRFRAQANRARQVQSRIKTLERMAEVAPIRGLRGIDIELPAADDAPETLLRAESLAAGYDGKVILATGRLQVNRGARIGILGRNGAGKSTLIKTIVGAQSPIAGSLTLARGLRVGYFAQQAVESLRAEESALWHMQKSAPGQRDQELRDFLGRFGFRGEDATRPTGPMSGGEKARLVLALIVWGRPQLLVLDEPTNHLDAQTRDALADALADYGGALLLVSHDRYLLRASVDRFVIVDQGRLIDYEGDLDDYHDWISGKNTDLSDASSHPERSTDAGTGTESARGEPRSGSAGSDRRTARRLAAEQRASLAELTRPIDAEIRKVEARLAILEKELGRVEAGLLDPALYAPGSEPRRAAELNQQRAELRRQTEAAETQWLSLQDEREKALAGLSAQQAH